MTLRPPVEQSFMEALGSEERIAFVNSLTDAEKAALAYDWPKWARPKQLPPAGDWDGWLVLAGRGFGKTRTGAEWVRDQAEADPQARIALVGETSADGKDVMVAGESGILSCCPPWNKPEFSSSRSSGRPKLTWPNGAIATLYDAREPDQLRGPQHTAIWFDELFKFRYSQEVFDQAMFGLRLGNRPRFVATSTPRPIRLLKMMLRDNHIVVTRGTSYENLRNLAHTYRRNVIDKYVGTRLGRQEIEAEVLEDIPGALWTQRNLDDNRVRIEDVPPLARVVVAIDPAITSGDGSNETGIVCGGMSQDQHGYLIEDASMRGTPDMWARRAVSLYRKYEADRIVAEANQGGEMVERVIRAVAPDVPITLVRATRGKYIRAEPVSALYEQGRISHIGTFPDLENQMCAFTPEMASTRRPGEEKDRADAMVWLWSDLFDAMATPQRVAYDDDERYNMQRDFASDRNPTTGY